MSLKFLPIFIILIALTKGFPTDEDYDSTEDTSDGTPVESCSSDTCKPPECSCFGTEPPGLRKAEHVPQFVMLTFDDAISVANAETYFKILDGRRNKANDCPITMTFFVCHEYNDYNITNVLYRFGNEIAVHSITHESNTDNWKNSAKDRWNEEMTGMREILATFGGIPPTEVVGHRAPFLQTAGNPTFEMLEENEFLYDSSMPTRNFMNPPLWPYTLDYGYLQDCQIQPCPSKAYNGLWVVPMVQYRKISKVENKKLIFHCSMVDACTPVPETEEETKDYLMKNFDRHYQSNKAPFPLFLHEAWLRDEKRFKGYIGFLDDILEREDVFVVTIHEVIEYMQKPVSLEDYKKVKTCRSSGRAKAGDCKTPRTCHFPVRNRFMRSCVSCPRRYPWLGNPQGLKQNNAGSYH